MTLAQRHGFAFFPIPGGRQNPLVRAFSLAHFEKFGYPLDTVPASVHWVAVAEKDQSNVQAIFGGRYSDEMKAWIIDDFFARDTRRGVLACYAALEYIKASAEATGTVIATPTPAWNAPMLKAMRRAGFPAPELVVTVYRPAAVVSSARQESEVA